MPLEQAGTGLELEEPIKFNHSANIPFANNGTGISFEPATKFDHSSNEPVLALVVCSPSRRVVSIISTLMAVYAFAFSQASILSLL